VKKEHSKKKTTRLAIIGIANKYHLRENNMKKIVAFTLLALFTNIACSQDNDNELEDAPKSYIQNLFSECKEYAELEEVASENLNTYLLHCINEELETSFYKRISSLPTEE